MNAGPSRSIFLRLAILVVLTLSWAVGAEAMTKHDGIPYAGGLKLDIYVPDEPRGGGLFSFGRARAPVVIYAHGGGWVSGTRAKVYSQPEWLTSEGYVFVSIDYRKVPETTIEGQVQDLANAIRWVRANISDYGGDPSNIVLMGHSAGAHLVAMIGARGLGGGAISGIIPNDVQAYDMVAYAGMRGSLGYPYLQAFGTDAENWVRWSPATYAIRNSGMPPHLIMASNSHRPRRAVISFGYANLLRSRGTQVYIFDGTDYTHGSIARLLGRDNSATRAIEAFLERVTR